MGKVNYNQWIDGNDCCGRISNCGCNSNIDKCDCDSILLDISKLYTNDEILQDEIDELSGEVETKLDTSAYTPVDLSDYYTKEQVDELIPTVPSLSGYATQDWVEQQGYLTTVEPLKTINGETLIGEGDIIISGGSIDAYTKTEADNRFQPIGDYLSGNALNGYATQQWVMTQGYLTEHQPLSGYVTNATFIQYINNLQQQINSLIADVSGCCGSSGETQYRWITETGANDYWCSGTTKMSKEKQQSSTDGINWTDTGAERSGSTVLETNCIDCGYIPSLSGKKYSGVTTANTEGSYDCNCNEEEGPYCHELIPHELTAVFNPRGAGKMKSVTVGDCVSVIGSECFTQEPNLLTVTLPSTITYIRDIMFDGSTSVQTLTMLATTPPQFHPSHGTVADCGLFSYERDPSEPPEPIPSGFKIKVPAASVNAYKAATVWSRYADYIEAIA